MGTKGSGLDLVVSKMGDPLQRSHLRVLNVQTLLDTGALATFQQDAVVKMSVNAFVKST